MPSSEVSLAAGHRSERALASWPIHRYRPRLAVADVEALCADLDAAGMIERVMQH